MAERQRFIGYMRVLDLYKKGKLHLPPADVIAARVAEPYKIPKRADGSTVILTDPEMKSSFTLRWHHERTRHWINRITLSTLHSLVLRHLNHLIGILVAIVVYSA